MDKTAKTKKKTTADIAFTALSAAIIVICSWISTPGAIPFTFQTFAVFAVAGILGCKRSVIAVVIYLLLGCIGIPVFSGFKGGIGVLLGPTGGYAVGFIFMALVAGFVIDKFGKKIYVMYIGMISGLIVLYVFGTLWYVFVYTKNSGAVSVLSVLSMCVFPYIIPDLIKMTLAVLVSKAVSARIGNI